MNITVLGAGLVGGPIALDLSKDYNVSLVDINQNQLNITKEKNEQIHTIAKDLSNKNTLIEIIKDADFVINAVPGFMGF